MSIFRTTSVNCPACNTKVEFKAVHSVNADRRPDLRANIIDETFQQQHCPDCGTQFRLDPEFNLMDTQRGQWIAAAPLTQLADWEGAEQHARDLFERAYGPQSNPLAQEIGKNLRPRITFGWPALREKLLASEYLLDDVVLELCKAFVMRNSDSPISAETELRLSGVVEGDLVLSWLMSADESPGPSMRLARTVYDQIAADEGGEWDQLKGMFADALFVDLNRLLIATPPAPVPALAVTETAEAGEAPEAGAPEQPSGQAEPEEEEEEEAEDDAEDTAPNKKKKASPKKGGTKKGGSGTKSASSKKKKKK